MRLGAHTILPASICLAIVAACSSPAAPVHELVGGQRVNSLPDTSAPNLGGIVYRDIHTNGGFPNGFDGDVYSLYFRMGLGPVAQTELIDGEMGTTPWVSPVFVKLADGTLMSARPADVVVGDSIELWTDGNVGYASGEPPAYGSHQLLIVR